MIAIPVSAPIVDPQTSYRLPAAPAVASSLSASRAYEPDLVSISPAAQQALQTSQYAYNSGNDEQY
jgi:hypothetical protein